jgi:micrococcal nuclease
MRTDLRCLPTRIALIASVWLGSTPLSAEKTECRKDLYGNYTVSKIGNVYDGDTFRANIKNLPPIVGKNIRIRIRGINTPEMDSKSSATQEAARAAQRFLENALKHAQRITLKNTERGTYFRIVADVYLDGKNLKDLILKAGHSKKYRYPCYKKRY